MDVSYDNVKQGAGYYSYTCVRKCAADGKRLIIEDRMSDGTTFQLLIRRIAVNEVTDVSAVAIVVLHVGEPSADQEMSYSYIAKTLSDDYIKLFVVDLDTDEYTELINDSTGVGATATRRGTGYFSNSYANLKGHVYEDDVDEFLVNVTKENVEKAIAETGVFSYTYRRYYDSEPRYVNFRAVKLNNKFNQLMVGLTDVDQRVKQEREVSIAREEHIAFSRIASISGDIIAVFTIDIDSGRFQVFNFQGEKKEEYIRYSDFFKMSEKYGLDNVHPDDLEGYLENFTKDKILETIKEDGLFFYDFRSKVNGKMIYTRAKGAIRKEEGDKLIVGMIDVDSQIKKEKEYVMNLAAAKRSASMDELTGVRNKRSFDDTKGQLDESIDDGVSPEFALAVFDLNGLKQVNDTLGHQAGDRYIKKGCDIICKTFKHSPVFRIGGDEFAVVVQGEDLEDADYLMDKISRINKKNLKAGDVVIAGGLARYSDERSVTEVFERADKIMYINKKKLKEDFEEE